MGAFRADRGPRPRKGPDPRVPADRDHCGRAPRSRPVAPGRPRPSPRRHANQQATDTPASARIPSQASVAAGSRGSYFGQKAAKPRPGRSDERPSRRAAWAPGSQGPLATTQIHQCQETSREPQITHDKPKQATAAMRTIRSCLWKPAEDRAFAAGRREAGAAPRRRRRFDLRARPFPRTERSSWISLAGQPASVSTMACSSGPRRCSTR